MITEFVRGFFSILKTPWLLLIALAAVLANFALVLVLADPLASLLTVLLSGDFSNTGTVFSLPFFLGNFGGEIGAALLLLLGTLIINAWLGVVFGRFARLQEEKRASAAGSIRFGFQSAKKIVVWALVAFLLMIFLGVLFLIAIGIANWNGVFGLIFFLIWLLVSITVMVLLIMSVPVLGVEDETVKGALKKTVELVKKHVWSLLGFLIIVLVFLVVWDALTTTVTSVIEDENLDLLAVVVFWTIQLVMVNLVLPFFYLNHSKEVTGLAALK